VGPDVGVFLALPDWWDGSEAPLVYLSFGTEAPTMDFFPGLYLEAIDALAKLPTRIFVTIGDARDPAELGPLPRSVHVEQWVTQAAVMPHAAAMVGHGGLGSTLTALTWGVPMAVVPLFADQGSNARRVAEAGAGVALEGGPAVVSGLPRAVGELLDDQSYLAGGAGYGTRSPRSRLPMRRSDCSSLAGAEARAAVGA
jgi:MGT family glycosyltransferase